MLYHIIVDNEGNKKGIIKLVNSTLSVTKADRLILAFPDREDVENEQKTHYPIYKYWQFFKNMLIFTSINNYMLKLVVAIKI